MSEKKAEKAAEAAMADVGRSESQLLEPVPDVDPSDQEGQEPGAQVNKVPKVPKDPKELTDEEREQLKSMGLGDSDRARAVPVDRIGKK